MQTPAIVQFCGGCPDAMGNFNHMQYTGDDFFRDKDVCSIVLELPNSELRHRARRPPRSPGSWRKS